MDYTIIYHNQYDCFSWFTQSFVMTNMIICQHNRLNLKLFSLSLKRNTQLCIIYFANNTRLDINRGKKLAQWKLNRNSTIIALNKRESLNWEKNMIFFNTYIQSSSFCSNYRQGWPTILQTQSRVLRPVGWRKLERDGKRNGLRIISLS